MSRKLTILVLQNFIETAYVSAFVLAPVGAATMAALHAKPYRVSRFDNVANVLNICELTIAIVGILVITQYNTSQLREVEPNLARFAEQIGDNLHVAGYVTLSIAFTTIGYSLWLDATLLLKQRQLGHVSKRAQALGASFSPDVFQMEYEGWMLPDWLLPSRRCSNPRQTSLPRMTRLRRMQRLRRCDGVSGCSRCSGCVRDRTVQRM